eukprot:6184335-Pleurochrysis_carterae.AAC.5
MSTALATPAPLVTPAPSAMLAPCIGDACPITDAQSTLCTPSDLVHSHRLSQLCSVESIPLR